MDGRIYDVQKLLRKDIQHKWTTDETCEIVGLSKRHFQKLFKTEIGITPIAYLRTLRLDKACDLLESTYLSIKEIGVEVGMIQDSHFTRDFKKKFGLSPSNYRKAFWKKTQTKIQDGHN